MAARCWPPIAHSARGTTVRVRIPAREVILATREPDGLSLHNALSGTVSALNADPAFDHVIVQIAIGRVFLLAEVTRDAIDRLGIGVGTRLYALIKSVSIGVIAARRERLKPPLSRRCLIVSDADLKSDAPS